jgi:hypothetical protein
MFLIPGISALFTFIYLRLTEVFEVLRPVNLNWVVAFVALGFLLDVRLGVTRLRGSAFLVAALVLFVLYLIGAAIKVPNRVQEQIIILSASLIAFLFVSQGVQTLRGIGVAAGVLLALTVAVAAIGVDQGLSTPMCYRQGNADDVSMGEIMDGRPCHEMADCHEGGLPDREYACEHPGLFETHSINKRVRFRGVLEDPNELSWVVAMGVPLAFALYERRRSLLRLVVLVGTLVISTACIIMTESRSGQLTLAAVLAVYFIRKFGVRGVVLAAMAALPVLLLGGRSDEASTEERLECWSEGLSMWRENPFLGVGPGQFVEHHYLTAHNSFVLTLAELGPIGLLLWSTVMYLAFKITIRAHADLAGRPETAVARTWATALLASMIGMLVSAFFLSIAYHPILWTFLGMVGALYAAVRAHDPSWKVRFGWRDLSFVVGADIAIVAGIAVYLRIKGY